jgi:hypothetical protein
VPIKLAYLKKRSFVIMILCYVYLFPLQFPAFSERTRRNGKHTIAGSLSDMTRTSKERKKGRPKIVASASLLPFVNKMQCNTTDGMPHRKRRRKKKVSRNPATPPTLG